MLKKFRISKNRKIQCIRNIFVILRKKIGTFQYILNIVEKYCYDFTEIFYPSSTKIKSIQSENPRLILCLCLL